METLADRMLKGYERDLTVIFQGKVYPLWVIMERLLKIIDKDANCIEFHLNYSQCMLYIEMCKQKREGKPIRQNVLKARQLGYSTFIAGVFFTLTMFTPNYKAGIVADQKGHAEGIFRKYQFFYDHLDDNNPNYEEIKTWERSHKKNEPSPLSYKPVLKAQRGQQLMETKAGNSILEVVVAGEGSGRSNTYNLLHLSECAFFENLKVTMNGLLECVSNKNKNSMVFLETTANGFNEYKNKWDSDVLGKGLYKAFFVSWFQNPDYSDDDYLEYYKKYGVEKELPLMEEWLYEKQAEYKLSNAQMMWYWIKYLEKDSDKGIILQEYPFNPTDSFLSTGSCIFGADMVSRRKEEAVKLLDKVKRGKFIYEKDFSLDGSQIGLRNTKFVELRNAEIRIYEEPIPGHPYVGVCDPNNGGSDSSAIQIFDNYTMKQVAVFKSEEMTLDLVAYQFYLLGKMYNWALLSNEMNLGQTVMEYLVRLNYPKLYIRQAEVTEAIDMRISKRYGHVTSKATRPQMIELAQIAFKENPNIIQDYETLTQMETFQKIVKLDSKGNVISAKEMATAGNHDDLVMAWCAYYIVRKQQTFVPSETGTENKKRGFASVDEAQEYYEEKLRRMRIKEESALERYTGIRF